MTSIRAFATSLLSAAALLVGTAAAAGASGRPPVTGFEPASVSFTSASTGFVLGEVPCGTKTCASVLATANGGRSWAKRGRPGAPLQDMAGQTTYSVSQVLFAGPTDGWAYGPALWATTDGAASWHREKLGGPVFAMAVAGRYAYAVVGSCYQSNSACGEPRDRLERAPLATGHWAMVPGPVGAGPETYFATGGQTVFVALWPNVSGPAVIWQSPNGTTWARHDDLCYQPSQAIDLAGLAATSPTSLFELCAGNPGAGQEGKYVERSANGGASAHLVGKLPLGGLVDGFAAATGDDLIVGAASGASFLYHSANGGQAWSKRTFNDGGAGLSDLQFAAPTSERAGVGAGFAGPGLGALVEGHPGLGSSFVWLSRDGGSSWSAVHF